jgi:hypothetical protein
MNVNVNKRQRDNYWASFYNAKTNDVCPDCGCDDGFIEMGGDCTCPRCGLVVEERMPDYTMTYADRSRVGGVEDEFSPPQNNHTRIDGGSRKMSKLHMKVVGASSIDNVEKMILDYEHELETELSVVHANALIAGRMLRSFKALDKTSTWSKNVNTVKAVCATLVSRNGVDHKDVARQFNLASICRKDINFVVDVLRSDPVMCEEMNSVERNNVMCCDDDEIRAILRIVVPSPEMSTDRFKMTQECIMIARRARVFPGLMGTQQKQLAATIVHHVCSVHAHSVSDTTIKMFINPATLKKKQVLLKECLKLK